MWKNMEKVQKDYLIISEGYKKYIFMKEYQCLNGKSTRIWTTASSQCYNPELITKCSCVEDKFSFQI